MQYGGKYWNIKNYLPYQRNFNFIDSERSIGKTYTTQGFFVERAIKKGEEFIYIVRTQDEKKRGVFEKAFKKVIEKEFKDYLIEFTKDECVLKIENEKGETTETITLGYCLALSEATKTKKLNLPNVKWLLFDEYIVDEKEKSAYVNSWNEPDLLLKIYHTIDRERDYVVCFLLANSISFFNPYHMHPAFNIPKQIKGKIWLSENVLFHWASATAELKEEKSKCKFLKMISGTEYGGYAVNGEYINDNTNFILERTDTARYLFTMSFENNKFAIWFDAKHGLVFIDDKIDPSCQLDYALTLSDHSENTLLTKTHSSNMLVWLSKAFKQGKVRFVTMELKAKCEPALKLIL